MFLSAVELPSVPVINVSTYGAKGDGSTDDTTAIAAAITALRGNLGVAGAPNILYFPPGNFKVTSTLDMTLLPEVHVLGSSGRSLGGAYAIDATPPCYLNYTAGGAGPAVNLAGSTGVVWDGLAVWATTAAYSGTLVNLDTTTAAGTGGNRFLNCSFKITSGSGTPRLLSLDGQVETSFSNVEFFDCPGGSQVRCINTGASAKFSNANSFISCGFRGVRTNSVLDPAFQTTFVDVNFEHNGSGVPCPIVAATTWNGSVAALNFHGCGFWDVTGAGSAAWLTSSVASAGWGVYGCYFSINQTGNAFDLGTAHDGLVVSGCYFEDVTGVGTPSVFKSTNSITHGSFVGNHVKSPVVDNSGSVFV